MPAGLTHDLISIVSRRHKALGPHLHQAFAALTPGLPPPIAQDEQGHSISPGGLDGMKRAAFETRFPHDQGIAQTRQQFIAADKIAAMDGVSR